MSARTPRIEIYRTTSLMRPGWRWRLLNGSGKPLAESPSGYPRRPACVDAAQRAARLMSEAAAGLQSAELDS